MGCLAISGHFERRRWRGSVYLPVLLIATVSATLTIGGLLVVQSHSRSVVMRMDGRMARANAVSAIEVARAKIAADPNWRLNHVNGAWVSNEPVLADGSQGTYSVSVVSAFGALDRKESDSVVITGEGRKGMAYQSMSVTLLPGEKTAHTCLTAAIAAAGNIYLTGTDVDSGTADSLLAANRDVIVGATDAQVGSKMAAQAVGVISGTRFNGTTTAGATALTFPDGANLAGSYPTATAISTGSLANVGGVPTLQTCVLSPASNPFGAVNSRGIYKMDCGGGPLVIKNCRVVGTLIVTNASLVTMDAAVVWEPAETAMPCLLVQGRLLLKYGFGSAIKLLENGMGTDGSGVAFNSNPAGTPYPYSGGTTDTDTTDSPNTLIGGLVYCSGDAEVAGPSNFHSLVSGGNVVLGNIRMRPVWESSYYTNPPPGFYSIRHTVVQGSYK